MCSFNSNVVRLKEWIEKDLIPTMDGFQFQCGAIKSYHENQHEASYIVSIPMWCD